MQIRLVILSYTTLFDNDSFTVFFFFLSLIGGNEIIQLQERLVSTEAQMCKILSALDAASEKVDTVTKTAKTSIKVRSKLFINLFPIFDKILG